ncbi:MAG: hypothetical protein ACREPQ_07440 [Rhodanobacter sp.]
MRTIVLVLLVAVVPHGEPAKPYAVAHPGVYAGSYAIRICRGLCSHPDDVPYLVGTLVLFDRPLRDVHGHPLRVEMESDPANGCFVLKQPPGQAASPKGFPRQKHVAWSLLPTRNAIEFELFRSPDGGYSVDLSLAAHGLSGTGMIWGGVVGTTTGYSPPKDVVKADWTGAPDVRLCSPLPDD